MAVNPITNRIYVANNGGGRVSVIDGAENTVIDTVGVGNDPWGVAVNPVTNLVYVANSLDGTVSVISNTYADVMAITDSVSAATVRVRPAAEAMSATDSVSAALVGGRPISDALSLSDSISTGADLTRPVSDTAALSDSIATAFAAAPVQGAGGGGGGGSGGGAGGRSVIITWPPIPTQPDSYFEERPLERIGVSNAGLTDAFGTEIDVAVAGQQVVISATLSNHQQVAQDYAFIVQVTDEDGAVVFIGWQEGNIGSGQAADISLSWTPEQAGNYTVKIFVWDELQIPAQPLSTVTEMDAKVT